MEKNKNLGILFIVLSAFSFAWMSTFVRLAGDLPSVEKSFFRNLVAVGVAAFTMIRSKEKIVMGKGNLKFLILRALFGTIGILGNFYAIDHLVLSDANMLNKMSPFFVILFSYLILKEDLTSGFLFDTAIREKMMIRDCSTFPFLDNKYIRFCIMNPEDNDRLLHCLLNNE